MIHYIPIITSIFAIYFAIELWKHLKRKQFPNYLVWWFIGVLTYGAGTITESINTLVGWSAGNFRAWYIFGALLGGFPLAQGTVYLLLKNRSANILSIVFMVLIVTASVVVLLSPVDQLSLDGRLTGKVLVWQWVRYFSPLINIYSFLFLFGGAIFSAYKYFRVQTGRVRFLGNVYIAVGALLPGIGGSFTRAGYVEVLYVTELLGLIAIFIGYTLMKRDGSKSVHLVQSEVDDKN